jgi:hypothetical protein
MYEQLPAQAVMDLWKWIGTHHSDHQSKLMHEYYSLQEVPGNGFY